MYNGKTKISLRVVLFGISVALKCTFSPIKAACSWKVRTYSVKMLHLHWRLWGCCLCAGVFLWAQSQRLQWEQSWLQAVGKGMHQDLAPYIASGEKVSRCLICLWSACGHMHLVPWISSGLWLWIGVLGPFLFVAPWGVMGSCTWALQKKDPPVSCSCQSVNCLSLLLSISVVGSYGYFPMDVPDPGMFSHR